MAPTAILEEACSELLIMQAAWLYSILNTTLFYALRLDYPTGLFRRFGSPGSRNICHRFGIRLGIGH